MADKPIASISKPLHSLKTHYQHYRSISDTKRIEYLNFCKTILDKISMPTREELSFVLDTINTFSDFIAALQEEKKRLKVECGPFKSHNLTGYVIATSDNLNHKPSIYDNTTDIDLWIKDYQRACKRNTWTEKQAIQNVSIYMAGQAKTIYTEKIQAKIKNNWTVDKLYRALKHHFGGQPVQVPVREHDRLALGYAKTPMHQLTGQRQLVAAPNDEPSSSRSVRLDLKEKSSRESSEQHARPSHKYYSQQEARREALSVASALRKPMANWMASLRINHPDVPDEIARADFLNIFNKLFNRHHERRLNRFNDLRLAVFNLLQDELYPRGRRPCANISTNTEQVVYETSIMNATERVTESEDSDIEDSATATKRDHSEDEAGCSNSLGLRRKKTAKASAGGHPLRLPLNKMPIRIARLGIPDKNVEPLEGSDRMGDREESRAIAKSKEEPINPEPSTNEFATVVTITAEPTQKTTTAMPGVDEDSEDEVVVLTVSGTSAKSCSEMWPDVVGSNDKASRDVPQAADNLSPTESCKQTAESAAYAHMISLGDQSSPKEDLESYPPSRETSSTLLDINGTSVMLDANAPQMASSDSAESLSLLLESGRSDCAGEKGMLEANTKIASDADEQMSVDCINKQSARADDSLSSLSRLKSLLEYRVETSPCSSSASPRDLEQTSEKSSSDTSVGGIQFNESSRNETASCVLERANGSHEGGQAPAWQPRVGSEQQVGTPENITLPVKNINSTRRPTADSDHVEGSTVVPAPQTTAELGTAKLDSLPTAAPRKRSSVDESQRGIEVAGNPSEAPIAEQEAINYSPLSANDDSVVERLLEKPSVPQSTATIEPLARTPKQSGSLLGPQLTPKTPTPQSSSKSKAGAPAKLMSIVYKSPTIRSEHDQYSHLPSQHRPDQQDAIESSRETQRTNEGQFKSPYHGQYQQTYNQRPVCAGRMTNIQGRPRSASPIHIVQHRPRSIIGHYPTFCQPVAQPQVPAHQLSFSTQTFSSMHTQYQIHPTIVHQNHLPGHQVPLSQTQFYVQQQQHQHQQHQHQQHQQQQQQLQTGQEYNPYDPSGCYPNTSF